MQAIPASIPALPAAGTATSLASRSETEAARSNVRVAGSASGAVTEAGDAAGTAPAAGRSATPLRRGLASWAPQLQRRLADAQQAQDYLDQTAQQLQDLKAALSAKLAGLQTQDSQLQAKLQAATQQWRQRQSASAGSLDPQLRFSSPATASQRFSVRGLDVASLQSGAAETLAISVGGGAQNLASVRIDPSLSADALVQRFDQALAPAGVRVASDDSGALIFSVAEPAWPALRDNLAVKGGGIRFPAGQLNRVKTDAEPAAIQPETWRVTGSAGAGGAEVSDAAALRRALQQVMQALDHVKQARASVNRALLQAGQQVESAQQAADPAEVAALAQDFQSTASRPGYASFSSVASALIGVSRSRVQSLLALPPTP